MSFFRTLPLVRSKQEMSRLLALPHVPGEKASERLLRLGAIFFRHPLKILRAYTVSNMARKMSILMYMRTEEGTLRLERAWQSAPAAQGTALVTYGIESYFVPEGCGRELERLVRDKRIAAVLAVDPSGTVAIKGLSVDGRLVHEEPAL